MDDWNAVAEAVDAARGRVERQYNQLSHAHIDSACQQTIENVVERLRADPPITDLRAYCYSALRNGAYRIQREQDRLASALREDQHADPAPAARQEREVAAECLEAFQASIPRVQNERYRAALVRRIVHSMDDDSLVHAAVNDAIEANTVSRTNTAGRSEIRKRARNQHNQLWKRSKEALFHQAVVDNRPLANALPDPEGQVLRYRYIRRRKLRDLAIQQIGETPPEAVEARQKELTRLLKRALDQFAAELAGVVR